MDGPCIKELKKMIRILQGRSQLERSWHRWEDNTEMILRETACESEAKTEFSDKLKKRCE
jgi:hypothetical protein